MGLDQRACDFSYITYFHPKQIIIYTDNEHIKSSETWQVFIFSYVRGLVLQRHVAGSETSENAPRSTYGARIEGFKRTHDPPYLWGTPPPFLMF